MGKSRHLDWLAQAKADLRWGEDSFDHRHYAQVCFIAQQVAEKALKAVAYGRGFSGVRGHSAFEILAELEINGELRKAAQILDQYYIATRDPDAVSFGNPSQFYTEEQARDALGKAAAFVAMAEGEFDSET